MLQADALPEKIPFQIEVRSVSPRRVLPEAFLSVGSEAQEPCGLWLLSL